MYHSLCAAIAFAPLLAAADPVRVQITTGGHPYDPAFHTILDAGTEFALTVNPHPSAYRRDMRKIVDVLVLYDLADTDGELERKNLQAYLESGRGLVVIHHALADNWQWKWWYEDVVGGRFLMGNDGDLPRSTAKAGEALNARPVAKHPLLEGLGELRFPDEVYKGMWISPKSRVLMETDNPNNDRPVVWIGPYQKSRVVCIQLGHGSGAYRDPGYRKLVRNAILWAAGRLN